MDSANGRHNNLNNQPLVPMEGTIISLCGHDCGTGVEGRLCVPMEGTIISLCDGGVPMEGTIISLKHEEIHETEGPQVPMEGTII